jgi:hypothetical protein
MQNSTISRMKKSNLDRLSGNCVFITFFIQLALCLFAAVYHVVFLMVQKDSFKNWIDYDSLNLLMLFAIRFGNWILIFGYFY